MINKFKTPVFSVAFKANSDIPKEIATHLEWELHMLINLHSAAIFSSPEKHAKFIACLTEYCKECAQEFLDELNSGGTSGGKIPAKVCDDWIQGHRRPNGTCPNCGEQH